MFVGWFCQFDSRLQYYAPFLFVQVPELSIHLEILEIFGILLQKYGGMLGTYRGLS